MSLLERIQSMDSTSVAAGGVGGVLGFFAPDTFAWFFIVLVFCNLWDWLLGRRLARRNDTFRGSVSRAGLQSKGDQLVTLGILRAVEWILGSSDQIPQTYGFVSVAVVLALIVDELESIEDNRHALGGAPIPLISTFIRNLRRLTGSERRVKDEGPPPGKPDRRSSRRSRGGDGDGTGGVEIRDPAP